ncbi:MAG: LacI family transcriptional regulator [Firmicutes bacterium]|nr:LacI family transcriptional regulator [Bacillota bacterium]
MVSIKDIAAACNVSTMTVSRAINGSDEISRETKERILKMCDKMGYRPNAAARNLVLNKTDMIGLVIPDIANQYYAYMSKGVSSYLEKLGYGLVLCNSDRNADNERRYLDFLTQRRVDGIILIPIRYHVEDYANLVNVTPFVQVDNYVLDLNASYIGNDNYIGGRKIITHMLSLGYRRIGAILSNKNSTASNERLKGYLDAHREQGVAVDEDILLRSNATFEDGYKLAEVLIDKKVDAIFGINDTVALGVMKYCYNRRVKVPRDLGVAGYDDIEQAAMFPVPLTTVHQPKIRLGEAAATVLLNEINNENHQKQKVILQPELVVRKSCGE